MAIKMAMDETCDICECSMVTDMHNCFCTGCETKTPMPKELTAKYRHKERVMAVKLKKHKEMLRQQRE